MFRIQQLQWLGIGVAAVGCVLLGAASTMSNLAEHDRHRHGAKELARFVVLLDAANAVSAERGPSNSAMGAERSQAGHMNQVLAVQRLQTDRAIAKVAEEYHSYMATEDGEAAFSALMSELAQGRAAVDAVTATDYDQRTTEQAATAIMSMFDAADRAAEIRNIVSDYIVAQVPQLAGEIMLANHASALREHEGRLGSYVVLALMSAPNQDERFTQLMGQSEGIVHSLWMTGLSMADDLLGTPAVKALIEDVQADFFQGSLVLAHETIEKHAGQNTLSPWDFTAKFMPGLRSSELLRTAIVEAAIDALDADADKTMRSVINSVTLTTLVLLALISAAILLRRMLFAPLMQLHEHVLALARGDLGEPAPIGGVAREVSDIADGLATLRKHQAEKRALEQEQRQLNRQLRRMADTDTLTGLLNRRALLNRVDAIFRRADRIGESVGVALFDIDHFKAINDTHGHAVGDEVLAGVSRLINGALRTGDALARIGGEEFVLVLRHVDEAKAMDLLENYRQLLETTAVQRKMGIKVTASFGVAIRQAGSRLSWDEIFSISDQRLYVAKGSGRNRVIASGYSSATRRRA
ncbi:diguanylate cyclase (GGDEF) domain-containing protein [Devosia crocina]|uniref:diguanylate cyclase n=1 Tax=Devosia crocina TaxID=429728 RepID=A0A1I7N752_9HYPH|nr:GGDEF domain-containing protein [Devosia crocina]SFV30484.1 diguanylate cyclase (GGDEF) domain-containing protein [Devosia crocina]